MLIYRIVLPVLLLILAGCATQLRTGSDLSVHVDQQLSEHHYAAALRSIDEFSARDANAEQLSQLRQRVAATAARYESETIATARAKVATGDWHAAQLIYRKARYRFPESPTLSAAEKDFTERRDAHIEHLRVVQYAEKASYLNAEIAQLEQINAATPFNLHTKRELAHRKDEQKLIATALLHAGERQLAAKNYATARRYLTLSNNLVVSAATEDALRQVPREVKQKPIKILIKSKPAITALAAPALVMRPDSNVNINIEFSRTMAAYYAARERGDWLAAQCQLKQALNLQPDNSELMLEHSVLLTAVHKHVQEKLENGKYLYSTGDVDAAIAAWQIAAALEPDNQALQQRLERARKFRQHYEELKK